MSLVTIKGKDGQDILIEVDDSVEAFTVAKGLDMSEKVNEYLHDLNDAGKYIMDVCSVIQQKYLAVADEMRPDEMTVEFGIKFSGEAGVPYLTKVALEAAIKVTAKWEKLSG